MTVFSQAPGVQSIKLACHSSSILGRVVTKIKAAKQARLLQLSQIAAQVLRPWSPASTTKWGQLHASSCNPHKNRSTHYQHKFITYRWFPFISLHIKLVFRVPTSATQALLNNI